MKVCCSKHAIPSLLRAAAPGPWSRWRGHPAYGDGGGDLAGGAGSSSEETRQRQLARAPILCRNALHQQPASLKDASGRCVRIGRSSRHEHDPTRPCRQNMRDFPTTGDKRIAMRSTAGPLALPCTYVHSCIFCGALGTHEARRALADANTLDPKHAREVERARKPRAMRPRERPSVPKTAVGQNYAAAEGGLTARARRESTPMSLERIDVISRSGACAAAARSDQPGAGAGAIVRGLPRHNSALPWRHRWDRRPARAGSLYAVGHLHAVSLRPTIPRPPCVPMVSDGIRSIFGRASAI